jgi:hypothetical protein
MKVVDDDDEDPALRGQVRVGGDIGRRRDSAVPLCAAIDTSSKSSIV